jgi:hypothetical protein
MEEAPKAEDEVAPAKRRADANKVNPAHADVPFSAPLATEARECLDLAAWIGALSPDDSLRSFTTLLIALLRAGNPLSRWWRPYCQSAGINLDAIFASRGFDARMMQEITERRGQGEQPSGKMTWTQSATSALKAALGLMSETGASEVGVRHLLAAYIYRPPSGHEQQLGRWGFDLAREGSAFARQMRDRHPAELEAWTRIHTSRFGNSPDLGGKDPPPAPRISNFASDRPEGQDMLDIEADVDAFASLISSYALQPPLAIGLFGEWGSGKSFYIQQIKARVNEITKTARESGKMQKDLPFLKRVAQIEFNAWHYSEGNLWASLVQHILDNLVISEDEREENEGAKLIKARRASLQQQMELHAEARTAAVRQQRTAARAVSNAQKEVGRLEAEHRRRIEQLERLTADDVLNSIDLAERDPATAAAAKDLLAASGVETAATSAGELLAAIDGATAALRRGFALFAELAPDRRRSFYVAAVLVVVAPVVLALLVGWLLGPLDGTLASVAALLGGFSTAATIAAGWLRQQTAWINGRVAELERVKQRIEQRVASERRQHADKIARLQSQIVAEQQVIAAARVRELEAEKELRAVQAQLSSVSPQSVLADFLRERTESQDYRKYLGLPAVIQRDFRRISGLLEKDLDALKKMTLLDEEEPGECRRINRIVLYIDDLDRCEEAQVVKVLQAVHLLLAFRIFVVVVAVDARWVSRSLARRFPGLLTTMTRAGGQNGGASDFSPMEEEGTATPYDYLEKIFQIPFWVQPPKPEAVRHMLRKLMEAHLSGRPGDAEPDHAPPVGGNGAEKKVSERRTFDARARAMEIQTNELEFIESLAPLIGRTPRAIKRFVNTYQVIKAGLPDEEQLVFGESDSSGRAPYQAVLLLLALATGLPRTGERILEELALLQRLDGQFGQRATLDSLVAPAPRIEPEDRAEVALLEGWLEQTYGAQWRDASASDLFRWAPRVGRFSYKLHR